MGWDVKEFPVELIVRNDNEIYHVYKFPKIETVPDAKTVYDAFIDHSLGHYLTEEIEKTYYAPFRTAYRIENSVLQLRDYNIYPNGTVKIVEKRPRNMSIEEDIVRYPGSFFDTKTREILKDLGFIKTNENASYNHSHTVYNETYWRPGFSIKLFTNDKKPQLYDVFGDKIADGELSGLISEYASLVEHVDESIVVTSRYVNFSRRFLDGIITVSKQPESGTFVYYSPPVGGGKVVIERYDLEFMGAVLLVKNVRRAKEVFFTLSM